MTAGRTSTISVSSFREAAPRSKKAAGSTQISPSYIWRPVFHEHDLQFRRSFLDGIPKPLKLFTRSIVDRECKLIHSSQSPRTGWLA